MTTYHNWDAENDTHAYMEITTSVSIYINTMPLRLDSSAVGSVTRAKYMLLILSQSQYK
jgi:hypothetical protein